MRSMLLTVVIAGASACAASGATGAAQTQGAPPSNLPAMRGIEYVSPAPAETSSGDVLDVTVRGTVAPPDGGAQPLRNGGVYHSHDTITLSVTPSEDAWVYVAGTDSRGRVSLLFPTGDEEVFVRAGQAVRLPPPGQGAMRLDESPGEEHLYVIASQTPLARADPRLHGFLTRARQHAPPDPPPRPARRPPSPPPEARSGSATSEAREAPAADERAPGEAVALSDAMHGMRTRGIERTPPERGAGTLQVRADGDGVVFWRIVFQHAR